MANEIKDETCKTKVLQELVKIAFANETDYVKLHQDDESGKTILQFTNFERLTSEQKAAIAGLEATSNGVKLKTYDKMKALELLGKHHNLFEKAKAESAGEKPKFKLELEVID